MAANILTGLSRTEFWESMEFHRYGVMAFTITGQSCMASVAVCYIMQMSSESNLVPLIIVAFLTMGANAACIAQGPVKLIVRLFVGSMIVSILLTIYALFSI